MSTTLHHESATAPVPEPSLEFDAVVVKPPTARPSAALSCVPCTAMPNGISDCRKKLRWLISSPPDNWALPMMINPPMARVMMERNVDDEWRNRPQSQSGLRRYIAAMRKGWQYTGETIVFSLSGRLLNGQHRLNACIEAQQPFPCLVAFGVDPEAFKFMDIGIARTAGHIFSIEGIPNYNLAAAALRIVYDYVGERAWGGRPSKYIENDELLDFYYGHEGIQQSLTYGRALQKHEPSLLPQRWGTALHYICACKSKEAADTFFKRVATGVGIGSASEQANRIRKRLLANANQKADRDADVYLAAYLIQAWNAHRIGEKREVFRWRGGQNPTQPFPRAI